MTLGIVRTASFLLTSQIRPTDWLNMLQVQIYRLHFHRTGLLLMYVISSPVCWFWMLEVYIRNKVRDLHAFDIAAMTETWLDRNYHDCELQLEGYNVYGKDRNNVRGGGVLKAVRNHITCIQRTDLEVEAEMIALEIRSNPTTFALFSVFYKPPVSFRDFLLKY